MSCSLCFWNQPSPSPHMPSRCHSGHVAACFAALSFLMQHVLLTVLVCRRVRERRTRRESKLSAMHDGDPDGKEEEEDEDMDDDEETELVGSRL